MSTEVDRLLCPGLFTQYSPLEAYEAAAILEKVKDSDKRQAPRERET